MTILTGKPAWERAPYGKAPVLYFALQISVDSSFQLPAAIVSGGPAARRPVTTIDLT